MSKQYENKKINKTFRIESVLKVHNIDEIERNYTHMIIVTLRSEFIPYSLTLKVKIEKYIYIYILTF